MRAKCSTSGRLGSFLQARAYAKQQTTRKQVGGRWCGSRTGAAALRMVAQVCRQCTHRSSQVKEGFFLCVSRGSSTREQENPKVCIKVGIANQFGSIVLSHDPRHPATSTLCHRRALLLANLVRHGNSLFTRSSPQPKLPQGLP
jgi:hypothetical protein